MPFGNGIVEGREFEGECSHVETAGRITGNPSEVQESLTVYTECRIITRKYVWL